MPVQMLTYRWWAKMYGWTPEQVAELPLEICEWFPAIEEAEHEAGQMRQRMQQRSAASPGKGGGPAWRA
jgi:hypothetical protein